MNNQKLSLEQLTSMSGIDLEQYRDRGTEWRRMLNNTVLGELALPEGWVVNAEEACEYCGHLPVVCRISPKGDDTTAIYLCSSGEDVPAWSAILPFQRDSVVWLHTAANFDPETINLVLKIVGEYYRHGFTQPEQLAVALRKGGLCI
jgi:hypothetical protein